MPGKDDSKTGSRRTVILSENDFKTMQDKSYNLTGGRAVAKWRAEAGFKVKGTLGGRGTSPTKP